MVKHALSVDGTSIDEHGIGLRERAYMREEHGGSLELMRALKNTLDPLEIVNPGEKLR